jgi:hypothetical protein
MPPSFLGLDIASLFSTSLFSMPRLYHHEAVNSDKNPLVFS